MATGRHHRSVEFACRRNHSERQLRCQRDQKTGRSHCWARLIRTRGSEHPVLGLPMGGHAWFIPEPLCCRGRGARPEERLRRKYLVAERHRLGFQPPVGRGIRYVAFLRTLWPGLAWRARALKCRKRNRFIDESLRSRMSGCISWRAIRACCTFRNRARLPEPGQLSFRRDPPPPE